MNLNYPVVLIKLTASDWSEFGHFPLTTEVDLVALVTERSRLPSELQLGGDVARLSIRDDMVREIASCEWFLYGIIRGSMRRYPESGDFGLTSGSLQSGYLHMAVAIVDSDHSFLRVCGDWGIELQEAVPQPEVDEVTDPKRIEWLASNYDWNPPISRDSGNKDR
jgi:hypothetical protein